MKTNVNVSKIAKYSKKGDTILVQGKVLSDGKIDFPVTVYAGGVSKSAREKIENAKGKVLALSELKTRKGVKVMK